MKYRKNLIKKQYLDLFTLMLRPTFSSIVCQVQYYLRRHEQNMPTTVQKKKRIQKKIEAFANDGSDSIISETIYIFITYIYNYNI